jgi:hypothetical protein
MKKHFYLLVLILLAFGCAGSKKSTQNYLADAPDWVRKSPTTPGYYHGVGSATKANTRMDFQEKARQNALSELAGSISVSISSSSVLSQYEYDDNYSEYFRDNIKLSSDEYLEGYELMDSWDNEDQYWVYYRLSIDKYRAVKAQRKNDAISKSMGDFEQAIAFKDAGKMKESIRFNIQALEDVRDFLAEDMKVEMDGSQQSYGSNLLSSLTDAIQNIRIVYPAESIAVRRGNSPVPNPIVVQVVDGSGRKLSGFKINSFVSWNPGGNIVSESDSKGEARIEVGKANTKKSEEFMESSIDLDKLIRESTSDPVIRKLLQNISAPDYVLPINVVAPSFFIEVNESNLGNPLEKSILFPEIVGLLTKDGFTLVDRAEFADLILRVTAITKTNSERNGMYSVTMSANILVTDNFGQQQYKKTIDDLSGLSDSFEAAGFDAYEALINRYQIVVYPEMYGKLFK